MSGASSSTDVKATAAGIVERVDTHQRVIPESKRADGSIRKERKVRPGFTPVEDVVRYRPARSSQAEEARKRGVPGSTSSASSASSASSPTSVAALGPSRTSRPTCVQSDSSKPDTDRTTWRSNTTRTTTASSLSDVVAQPRGNFASLQAPRNAGNRVPTTNGVNRPEAPGSGSGSGAKPWQNSRLRKPLPPKQSRDEMAAVPNADQPQTTPERGPEAARTAASADDLAAELENLCVSSRALPPLAP